MKKRGLEISFGWLFAIIVGIFILFLAIYGSTKTIRLGQYKTSTETGKEIEALLNPLEIGFETGKVVTFTLPTETRIYNICENESFFGEQKIKISEKSFGKWSDTTKESSYENKYIFSGSIEEGKKFYIFSKPFEFPFKVADLIFLIPESKRYCFVDAPPEVQEELSELNQENLLTNDSIENCPKESIKVCFSDIGCDIKVGPNYVKKDGKEVRFEGDALMYAAIFSDKDIYECQLKRLMNRGKELTKIYMEKAILVSQKGCENSVVDNLLVLHKELDNFENPDDLNSIAPLVDEIKDKNEYAYCRLW